MEVFLRRIATCFVSAAVILLAPRAAQAAGADIVPGSRYVSARGAAMGDAFLPIADDAASGLFYNPAAIAKMRLDSAQIEPLNLTLNMNSKLPSQMSSSDPSFYKVTNLTSYYPTLQKYPGDFTGVGGQYIPSVYYKGFAFGVLLQSQVGAQANADGTVTYRSVYRFVPTAGIGARLAGGIVRIGYSLQWVNQASTGLQIVDPTKVTLGYDQRLQQGSMISHNVGFALTLPYQFLPQLNIVGRNLFSMGYTPYSLISFAKSKNGTPNAEQATFDASISYVSKLGAGAYFNVVAEDRDFTGRSYVPLKGRLAGGVEFSFRDALFLRGGWGSGYPAAGIGFRRKQSEISFTWMSEEIGLGYHDKRDMRYLVQYQVRAF